MTIQSVLSHLILLEQMAPTFLRPHVHCPHERHVLEAWSTYADPHELVTVFLCEGTSSLCTDVVLHRKWPFTVCCVNRQGKSTGCELLKVWKVFRVEPADGLTQNLQSRLWGTAHSGPFFSEVANHLFSVDNRFCACGLVIPPWLLSVFSHQQTVEEVSQFLRAISCTWMRGWAGWAMYPTDRERWKWTKSDKNLFNLVLSLFNSVKSHG